MIYTNPSPKPDSPDALHSPSAPSPGGRLVDPTGQPLPLLGCSLEVVADCGLARVVLRQTFRNDLDLALQAIYLFPLPADAAVGQYEIKIGDTVVRGELHPRAKARERFSEAVLEGRTAGLVDQDRSSFFRQEIGNIPAGALVECQLEIDQPLIWREGGQWEWRFPTTIAPRYMGRPGTVADQTRVEVEVSASMPLPGMEMELLIRGGSPADGPWSPSHHLYIDEVHPAWSVDGVWRRARFASGMKPPMDRDVVVRWKGAEVEPSASIATARLGDDHAQGHRAFGYLTITPPAQTPSGLATRRDLVLLLDTSGSMRGRPLEATKRLTSELIRTMRPEDTLELISFSNAPEAWREEPQPCAEPARRSALAWVAQLEAGGGTEMATALMTALGRPCERRQRQVVVITDGLVGFESDTVREVRRGTPQGCRVHVVGVGSASNRSLTMAVAAAGGGCEFLVDLEEDLTSAAEAIRQRLERPIVTDLAIRGSVIVDIAGSERRDLMEGAPACFPVELRPEGGSITVEGITSAGTWRTEVEVPPIPQNSGNPGVVRLFGRARAARLELEAACGVDVRRQLERIGRDFGVATREVSWIAVSTQRTVDPAAPFKRTLIPQAAPHGMSLEGLGLRVMLRPSQHPQSICRSLSPPEFAREVVLMRVGRTEWRFTSGDMWEYPQVLIDASVFWHHEGLMVVEFELDRPFPWDPVAVRGRGRRRIDRSSTTAAGAYQAGDRIRLGIRLPPSLAGSSIVELLVRCRGGQTLLLRVRR